MSDFEGLKKEVFQLFDMAEQPFYKGYHIYTEASRKLDFSLSNFRKEWQEQPNDAGNPRSVRDTKENRAKARKIVRTFGKLISIAKSEMERALDTEVEAEEV
ncbi:MAG TPA: hypothetical protein VFM69_13370 [Pricia sp.]|nr:hypothetical protein [Pricia sp.]